MPTSSSKRLAAALVRPRTSSKSSCDLLTHIRLTTRQEQADQPVEYVELPNCTHEGIVFAAMGDPVECLDSTTKHLRRFLFGSPLSPPAQLPSKL